MRSRPPASSFVAAVAALIVSFFVTFVTARASAQTIALAQEQSLPRVDANGQMIAKRPPNLSPEAINAQDCRDDQRIRFPILMDQFEANAVVQLWASTGSDCSIAENRTPGTGPCWSLGPDVPLQAVITLDVPVRTILSPTSDERICGTLDMTVIDVQILMFAPGNRATAAVSKHVAITADTVGPQPPRASVTAGNGRARIELRAQSDLTLVTGVIAYCERSASQETCSGGALVPGSEPDPSRECGSIFGSTGSTFFTEPLENGVSHVVAVAARDQFGNVGPLSSLACATPSPDAETKVQTLHEPTGCTIGGGRPRRAGGTAFGACAFGALALVATRRRRAASPGR